MIHRVFVGFGLSTTILFVTIVGQIFSVPVFLLYWGTQTYGEYLTLTNLAASLSIFNLGVQSYVSNRLIIFYVRGEINEGTKILHAGIRLYFVLTGIALSLLVALILWPDFIMRLKITSISILDVQYILGIQGLIGVYAIFGGLLMNLFCVTNQLPRQLFYGLVERIAFLGIPILVVVLGGYPVHASIFAGLGIMCISIISIYDVKKKSPYKIGIKSSNWKTSFLLIRPSLLFFFVALSSQLLSIGIILIISATKGATAVALFATTLMLTNFVRSIINQGLNVLWPEITGTSALPTEDGRLARWHRLIWKLVVCLTLISGVAIGLLGPDILLIWTRGKISVDSSLNLLLVAYLVIQSPALVTGIFGLATNKQGEMLIVQVITVVATTILAVWLVPGFGVRGAAFALIGGQILGTWKILTFATRWTADTWSVLVKDVVARGLPTIAVVLLVTLGTGHVLPTLLSRALFIPGLAIFAVLVGWWTWLTQSEREVLIERWVALLRSS